MGVSESSLAPARDAAYAWQLLHLHRPELALALTAQLLAANPAGLSALLAHTEALRQLACLPEAAEAARTTVARVPQSDRAFAALAQVCGQQGQLHEAEKAISEALRLDPLAASYYGLLAQLQYLQGQATAAVASAEAGLRLHARHPDCLLWRAVAEEKLAHPAATDTDFTLLLHLAPSSMLVHLWRGRLLLHRYEPHAADTHLTEALRLAPTNNAELVPLLRQARRRQHWPSWLLRLHQQRRHDWEQGFPFSWRGPAAGLATVFFGVRGWWRTRRDPLFSYWLPGQRQALMRKWLTLAGLTGLVILFVYSCVALDLPPLFYMMSVLALLRFLATYRAAL